MSNDVIKSILSNTHLVQGHNFQFANYELPKQNNATKKKTIQGNLSAISIALPHTFLLSELCRNNKLISNGI